MNRIEGGKAVRQLVADFSADDVRDWLAEACTEASGAARRRGQLEEAVRWMHFANAIAAVRNEGV